MPSGLLSGKSFLLGHLTVSSNGLLCALRGGGVGNLWCLFLSYKDTSPMELKPHLYNLI